MIGASLAHYKVLSKLGEGGMGEVWRAEDTKLGREVALKLLPEAVAEDPERLARFEREAQSIAALTHENIVTLYSVERAGGTHLLTMEVVEGRSLDQVLPPSGFDLERLLPIASQIAGALAAAHAKGIAHRDLKPANVMLTEEGRVKVLDFGLAKLTEAEADEGKTELLTQAGMVLGTVAYMSPEQVQGKPTDHRSDIFSLGVVLHEMATGERPFQGDNAASVISAVLREEPAPVTALRSELPNHLGRVIRRCLEKAAHRRFQSALDVQLELEGLERERLAGKLSSTSALEGAPPAVSAKAASRWSLAVAGAFVFGALGSYLFLHSREPEGSRAPTGSSARTLTQVTDFAGAEAHPSLSPDGKQVVYAATRAGQTDLHLLRIGGENPLNLTADSPADDTHPAFSPDGESIAFRSDRGGGGLFVMGATGESVRRLTEFGYHPAWSPDGTAVAFSTEEITEPTIRTTRGEIWVVEISSGELRQIPSTGDASQPTWSPDGRWIAYWGLVAGTGQRDLFVVPAAEGDPVNLTDDGPLDWDPFWSPDGRYLYFASDRGGSRDLWRLPMKPATGEAAGPPEPMTFGAASIDQLAISASGSRVAFVSRSQRFLVDRLAFDATSETVHAPGETLLESTATINTLWLSQDGERLLWWAAKKTDALLTARIDGSDRRLLIQDEFRNRTPVWCDGDRRVLFASDRDGTYEIWSIGSDGSGLAQVSDGSPAPGGSLVPICSRDGKTLYFTHLGSEAARARLERWLVGEVEVLPNAPDGGDVIFWSLSPDQGKLAGSIWREGLARAAAVYDIAAERYTVLPFSRGVPFGSEVGRWLSDSRRFALVLDGTLTIADAETAELRPVAGAPRDAIRLGDVSSDDRHLLVVRAALNEDIWLLDL